MDDDLTTGGPTGTGTEPRWPTALPLPPLEPLDWDDLAELRAGDVESDRTEALAVMASRGRGALDLAIGDGLAALKLGDRLISLGFSGVGDYGQEVLGIQSRTAQSMARLSLELQKRPLLRSSSGPPSRKARSPAGSRRPRTSPASSSAARSTTRRRRSCVRWGASGPTSPWTSR